MCIPVANYDKNFNKSVNNIYAQTQAVSRSTDIANKKSHVPSSKNNTRNVTVLPLSTSVEYSKIYMNQISGIPLSTSIQSYVQKMKDSPIQSTGDKKKENLDSNIDEPIYSDYYIQNLDE